MPSGFFGDAASLPQLHEVARATTVVYLMYASPSWWGFTNARDRAKMGLLINMLKHCGFLPMSAPYASILANETDRRLFRAIIQGPNYALRKLLPEARRVSYHLRHRVHGFQLPTKDDRNLFLAYYIKPYILTLFWPLGGKVFALYCKTM